VAAAWQAFNHDYNKVTIASRPLEGVALGDRCKEEGATLYFFSMPAQAIAKNLLVLDIISLICFEATQRSYKSRW
jgi:hypothetical protein